jgi:hypothetical protein
MYSRKIYKENTSDMMTKIRNNKDLAKLHGFLNRTDAYSYCPVDWTPEVLELLEELDNTLGIKRNTQTIDGMLIEKSYKSYIKIAIESFYYFSKRTIQYGWQYENKYGYKRSDTIEKNALQKTKSIFDLSMFPIVHALKAIKAKTINNILNKIHKPKIVITQIKEKYGTLRLYYIADPIYRTYVDDLIKKAEVKLAKRGVYSCSIEDMWNIKEQITFGDNAYCQEDYDVKVESNNKVLTKTVYRQMIKELEETEKNAQK